MISARVERVLIACLHQDRARLEGASLASLDDDGWNELLGVATVQRVRPIVYQRLADGGFVSRVPPSVWNELKRATLRTAAQALLFQAEAGALARELSADDIPVAALKGLYLGPETYGNVSLREMIDIDVLVPRPHLQRAVDVLLSRGYAPLKPFSIESDTASSHHVTRLMKGGFGVEIHWNIVAPGFHGTIEPSRLWDRAIDVRIGNVLFRALSPEDLILHLCLHTSYMHRFEFGVRPLCDVATTVARFGDAIDWQRLADRSRQWKADRGVALTLRLAAEMIGAAVPDSALNVVGATACDPDIVESARAQVLADKAELRSVGEEFALLGEELTAGAKVRRLRQRTFLPRAELAAAQGLSPRSPRLALAYVARLFYLLRLYGWKTVQLLLAGEPALSSIVKRKNRLRGWLLET